MRKFFTWLRKHLFVYETTVTHWDSATGQTTVTKYRE